MLAYFRVLSRHFFSILLVSLLLGIITFGVSKQMLSDNYEVKLSFVVGVDNLEISKDFQNSPTMAMLYPDHFADVINGWMQTESIVNDIFVKLGQPHVDNYNRFAVKKMERQTLSINTSAKSREQAQNMQTAIKEVLQTRVERYNENNNTNITLSDVKSYSLKSPHPFPLYALGAFIFGIILMFVLWQIIEYFRGKIIIRPEIEDILCKKTALSLNRKNMDAFLSLLKAEHGKNIVCAGINIDPFKTIILAWEKLEQEGKNVCLTDASLSNRNLHNKMGVSKDIPSFNGFTDIPQKEFENIDKYLFDMKKGNFRFLPAGQGNSFPNIVFDYLAKTVDVSLVQLNLRKDLDVLSKLSDSSTLVLFYKLGVSETTLVHTLPHYFRGRILLIEIA